MAREVGSANPELVIRDTLPAHLDDLHKERDRLVGKLLAVNERIALCETLARVAPQPEPERGPEEP